MIQLEICAVGLRSSMIAEQAGAHRIELCENLESGGLTPSYGTLKAVRQALQIPVHVLIRPRRGDYVYDSSEIDLMAEDISMVKSLGFEGVVIGALSNKGSLDFGAIKQLLKAAEGMSVSFHRAIDVAANPFEIIEQLIELQVPRVLTSGGKPTALEGIETLAAMQKQYGAYICILPGSGINSGNAKTILQKTGVKELHLSAKRKLYSNMQAIRTDGSMSPLLAEPEWWHYSVDEAEIKNILQQFTD